jgi:predicted MPP superfamily phosphohydrolase
MKLAFAIFVTMVLAVWTLMHAYVFWRLASVAWVGAHLSNRTLALIALALWLSYPLARVLHATGPEPVAVPMEWIGSVWIGTLFLLLSTMLLVDLVTLGGRLFSSAAPGLRGLAAVAGLLLALLALVQGLRPPAVREHEIRLAGLPRERDGLVLVAVSDLHLGMINGERWTERLVERIHSLRPDLVAVVGDVIDGRADRIERLHPLLRRLDAPLGNWAVTGNHEYYTGLESSVRLMEEAGLTVLRDRWHEVAPGLVVAGVDDLTARQQFGEGVGHVAPVLADLPAGGVVLLSHSPLEAEEAAAAGAGLMISGHTHSGQIWPFGYLVRLRYPLLAGRYDVDRMAVLVCRGTGTWGPPMRLWRRSEILRITLRAPG